MVILELIHASKSDLVEGLCLLVSEPMQASPDLLMIHDNCCKLHGFSWQ